MTHDVFISYRREGGEHLAGRVKDALKIRGFSVFMDVEDLKFGRFDVALLQKIEEATDVLVILTPGCLDRCKNEDDWLRQEIRHAIKWQRNIVPILARGFQGSAADLPPDMSVLLNYNGLTPTGEMFEASMDRLASQLLKSKSTAHLPTTSGALLKSPGAANDLRSREQDGSNPIAHSGPAGTPETALSILEVESDPPGADVIIDGGKWKVKTPVTIIEVPWGRHHFKATLEEETQKSSFEVQDYECPLSIVFLKVKSRRAEENAEKQLWSITTTTDTEEAYKTYLTESRSRTQLTEAEKRLKKLTTARVHREEEERQRLEKEAAAERARLEAEAREQKLWVAATSTDTKEGYALYLKDSRLLTHRIEAETRVEQIRVELARQKEERREEKLWVAARKEDSEHGYASYLEKSQLGAYRTNATNRREELRAERDRREEKVRRQREKEATEALARQEEERGEQTIWDAAKKANNEESYALYLTESRLFTHRLEAQRNVEQLREEQIRKKEEEHQRREKEAAAERARQAAVQQESVLWEAATKDDTPAGYQAYLAESVLLLHKQEAQDRLAQFRAAQLRREEEEARVRREKEVELAREIALQKDRETWAQADKRDTEDGYRLYLAQVIPLANKAVAEARLEKFNAERLRKKAEDATPAGTERTLSLAPGVDLTMCWIPATTGSQWKQLSGGKDVFLMGSPPEEEHRCSDEDLHPVRLTKGFWMGKYPVTLAQWKAVMGEKTHDATTSGGQVCNETWSACAEFVEKLNKHVAGGGFRLPTEAEWEYACRAGRTGSHAWAYEEETSRVLGIFKTIKVVAKDTNPWNLKGMYVGPHEWCSDCYGKYPSGLAVDPVITTREERIERVLRGACSSHKHSSGQELARIAHRSHAGPDESGCLYGLRLARTNPNVQDSAWPRTGDAEMAKWYRKAAEQGDAAAQCNLGLCYANGTGVAKDVAEAVKWFRKAAEQEYAQAQCNLGECYKLGTGVAKDKAEAVKWFRKAAEQEYAQAQYKLGNCLHYGTWMARKKAMNWYRKAAEQGHAEAQYELGANYYIRTGLAKNKAEVVKWHRKAAEQGHVKAQYCLGWCYEYGTGVAKDVAEAVKWYRKAAEQGYADAQTSLGTHYKFGTGVAKDVAEAVKWYRKAAEQGECLAQHFLGECYELGTGVAKDVAEAIKWYRKAAEQGDAGARKKLASMPSQF